MAKAKIHKIPDPQPPGQYSLSIDEVDDIQTFQQAMTAFMDLLDGKIEFGLNLDNMWFLLDPHWRKFNGALSSATKRWEEKPKAANDSSQREPKEDAALYFRELADQLEQKR